MPLTDIENHKTAGAIAHRVLVVENDAEFAASVRTLLERNGYEVYTAKDGGQAQSVFVMRQPDFVVLGLILPNETGFEVCERLKQTNAQTPVLVLSAIDMDDARDLAKRVGADRYLTKPVSDEALLAAIRETSEAVWQKTHSDKPKDEGRVRFECACGKRFKVSPSHRGKSLTCPSCAEPVIVPRHD
jgi:two-component system OmpR family response regulator